ncbi:MAG: hypothetical protein BRD40_01675 [Bacteroidetes bacterium QS_1_65_9]|nr:MAG: hypothetical protein BRD40_01675 [Bacteroidetes bacterium QS_1_65_9]
MVSVHSVTTLGSEFDSATFDQLSFPAHFSAANAEANASWALGESEGYPNWDKFATFTYRIELPSAYDVSYSGLELVQTTKWRGERYTTVQYAENVGDDTTASDLSDSDWSDKTSAFDAKDKEISLDSTVSTSGDMILQYEMLFTDSEASDIQQQGGGADGAGSSTGASGLMMRVQDAERVFRKTRLRPAACCSLSRNLRPAGGIVKERSANNCDDRLSVSKGHRAFREKHIA